MQRHRVSVIEEPLNEPVGFARVQHKPVSDHHVFEERPSQHRGLDRKPIDEVADDASERVRRTRERRDNDLLQTRIGEVSVAVDEPQQKMRREKRRRHLAQIQHPPSSELDQRLRRVISRHGSEPKARRGRDFDADIPRNGVPRWTTHTPAPDGADAGRLTRPKTEVAGSSGLGG